MLASIISLLQDQPQPAPRPRTQKIELRGGGGPRIPMYDIVDYIAALDAFPAIAGEDPVQQAARRAAYLGPALELARARRTEREERAAATGMLWGAALERKAQEEAQAAAQAVQAAGRAAAIAELVPATTNEIHARGASGSGAIVGVALGFGLLGLGIALTRQRR